MSDLTVREGPHAASCSRETVAVVEALIRETRGTIESITHADFSWAAATKAIELATTQPRICAVQCDGESAHTRLLGIEHDSIVALRRLPPSADDAVLASALMSLVDPDRSGNTSILALGDETFRECISRAAAAVGVQVVGAGPTVRKLDYDPEAVAAAFAGAGPRFVPPEVVAAARSGNRKRALMSAAVAAVLVGVTAFLDTIDLRRELDAVSNLRDAHASEVQALMDDRARSADLEAMTAALEDRRGDQARWTLILSSLSDGLPSGAHVRSLRAQGDSIALEIEGSDAATAFDALRAIPWLTGFRTIAPVQREIDGQSGLTERLTASAAVSWTELNPAEAAR